MTTSTFARAWRGVIIAGVLAISLGASSIARADLTPQPLPFLQDWTNTGLITADDNWSGVPGIIGYRGDSLVGGTAVDPQTVLGEGTAVIDVNANQANPNTFTTGGVTEFHIANPAVALQGSGTARAPNLVVTLNTTGFSSIQVSYNVRDIDGSADNAVQAVALQYRVGTTGNFTNVPAGFVGDASTGPSLATAVTAVTATLPAAADDQAVVQIRMITTDAVGSDEWVAIDDISVMGTPAGNAPPSITTQPSAQTVTVGSPASFSVVASGSPTLAYQWRKGGGDLSDGGNLSGTQTATLSIASAQLGDGGDYDVVVSNSFGSAPSNLVALTVNPAPVGPSITTSPLDQTVNEGATVQFVVVAFGSPVLEYQWRKGGENLSNAGIVSGAQSDTLTLTGVQLSDSGDYDVIVTNSVDSVISQPAVLTVNEAPHAPHIITQPVSQNVVVGGTAVFTVEASGTSPLTYQWRKGGSPLSNGGVVSGADAATLTLSGVSALDAGDYDVVVSNAISPAATSDVATLSVQPLITPGGQISYVGGDYVQTFDTLPSGGTFTFSGPGPFSLAAAPVNASGAGGWSFLKYAGSGTNALFSVNTGSGTSGNVYSYGLAAATDRALGSLASGSTVSRLGVTLVNHTGRTITQFTLGYSGEQWRRGGSGNTNTLTFAYGVGAKDLATGTFTAVPALNFSSVSTVGGGAALVGNDNRVRISASVTGLTWEPGQSLVMRWTDVDDTGSDDGLAVDDLTFTTDVAPGDIIPAVAFSSPAAGLVNVPVDSPLSVTFNEAVNVTGNWFVLSGSASGLHPATISGGPTSFTLTPLAPFAEGEDVTLQILAAQVTDAATGTKHPSTDFSASFFTFSSLPIPIHTIQGSGLSSPFANYPVTVQGIVVASFQGAGRIGGYYLEAPDNEHDANPETSEGIYVFDNLNSVAAGDVVTITGTVTEYGSDPTTETEIAGVTAFTKLASGAPLPTPATVTLPFAAMYHQERYEGMLVTFPQVLTVTDNYDQGHFGELILSNGRLANPTNIAAPGAPAQAQAAANLLNQILLDDGSSTTYPDPTPYLSSNDPTTATRRAGSTTTGVTGIIDNRFGAYVLEPTNVPTFVDANPRGPAPAVGGRLHVAIGNVLNFFNGDGNGGGFPTSRGATNVTEYQRQRAKIIAGISAVAPDIMGLTEVENDGFGPLSAIADLVNGLNAVAPPGTTYAFVDGSAVEITTDVIHVAFIYRTETVETVGAPKMLSDPAFNNLARNPLAQTFREKSTGEKLTVCINHFRAKGSPAAGAGNPDSGDGQGTNNALRTQQAIAVTNWLATDPTGSEDADFLIIGDLNAYAQEDPITTIESKGYVNLTETFEGVGGYSYSFNGEFGHLDHALANGALATQVVGAATWHVNSDEPIFYDYNTEDKTAGQLSINLGTAYRYSDHDPVVVGIDLTSPARILDQPVAQTVVAGNSVTLSVTAAGTPAPTYQWRKDGTAIEGAVQASLTLANPGVADSGSYDVVVTNSLDTVYSVPVVITVTPAPARITLSNLDQRYDGTPRPVTAVTTPDGLGVSITYGGSTTVPTYPGAYAVEATITDPNYSGSASDVLVVSTTALVRHAPVLNGGLDGSIQLLLPEGTGVSGTSWLSGDLLVPGTPTVTLKGTVTYGGTLDGPGSASPANYKVTLNSGSVLRHVVRRITPVGMPTVATPPSPTGTRSVTLTSSSQTAGDFSTLRNLTLKTGAGTVAVPPGTYGAFTVTGAVLRFGTTDGTLSVYNLESLTIKSGSRLDVVGPVVVNLANGTTFDADAGAAGHSDWLELNVATGGVTVNSGVTLHGVITAPSGVVRINSGGTIIGSATSDRLTLNENGLLK